MPDSGNTIDFSESFPASSGGLPLRAASLRCRLIKPRAPICVLRENVCSKVSLPSSMAMSPILSRSNALMSSVTACGAALRACRRSASSMGCVFSRFAPRRHSLKHCSTVSTGYATGNGLPAFEPVAIDNGVCIHEEPRQAHASCSWYWPKSLSIPSRVSPRSSAAKPADM